MKIMTILGTRPEIIRLSLIIKRLDQLDIEHILVHTGQNFTYHLSDIFFNELQIRQPDYRINFQQMSFGEQTGTMFQKLNQIIQNEKPDRVLVLGDTNSALSSILVERMNIPVIHMEAGNRCFDLQVPEEKNRKIIDTVSSYNLPYTENSKSNLLKEGIQPNKIIVTGNPIYEVLEHYTPLIDKSQIHNKLHLKPNDYFLVTAHRAESVDHPHLLKEILKGVNQVAEHFNKRVIFSVHPRTKAKIEQLDNQQMHPFVELYEPFGFFDFISLEKAAFCVLTDSGTVQEECCIFRVPTVTIRNTTERPETVECGSNTVSGVSADRIFLCTKVMAESNRNWECPNGYLDKYVSDKVVKFLLGGLSRG